jgi:hypothetical protein
MASVAAFVWNRWQLWRGIGGRIRLELVAALAWNTQWYRQPSLALPFPLAWRVYDAPLHTSVPLASP